MSEPTPAKTLTHDEKKAAEAAFSGRPFNAAWSVAARAVYDGIVGAIKPTVPATEPTGAAPPLEDDAVEAPAAGPPAQPLAEAPQEGPPHEESPPAIRSRAEAVEAGLLIDVTPLAHRIGLPLPVGITKPLWDFAVTASHALPEDQQEIRLRDILLALRLRLATARTTIPWIEFPVLLAFPPEPVPQFCVLHAIMHEDPSAAAALTLALREEVSTVISPLNN